MLNSKIRKRKDGGFSTCSSPDELVGRGRCCHVLEDGDNVMELSKIQRGMYEVKVNDSKLQISAQKEDIMEFFRQMPQLDQEKQRKILEFLSEE